MACATGAGAGALGGWFAAVGGGTSTSTGEGAWTRSAAPRSSWSSCASACPRSTCNRESRREVDDSSPSETSPEGAAALETAAVDPERPAAAMARLDDRVGAAAESGEVGPWVYPARFQSQRHHRACGSAGRSRALPLPDGIVSTAGLVVGVAAVTPEPGPILTAGIAGLVAGAVSMALGEYVSVSSQRDTERAYSRRRRPNSETFRRKSCRSWRPSTSRRARA